MVMNMKALIICQVEKRHVIGRLAGGIQAVERLHAELLAEIGYEVHFVVTSDSDDLWPNHKKIKTHRIGGDCEEAQESLGLVITRQARGKMNRRRSQDIEDLVQKLNPAIVINHSFSSSQLNVGVRLAENWPVLSFLHCLHDSASDIGMFAKLEAYQKLTESGGEVVCVSKYQRDRWRSMIKARMRKGSDLFDFFKVGPGIDQVFEKICYNVAVEKNPVEHPEDYYVVIGRPEKDKNIGKVLDICNKMKKPPKLKVFMAFGGKLEDYAYYHKAMKEPYEALIAKGADVEFLCNRPRQELLDTLKKAKGHILTCKIESFSIAAIEAMSYGVPSIVLHNIKNGHACFEVCGLGNFFPVPSVGKEMMLTFQAALKTIEEAPLSERERLRDAAITKHHHELRKMEMRELTNDIIRKYTLKKIVRPVRDLIEW
jgi:glycosyltransferase involved in cell wall biosynthesis